MEDQISSKMETSQEKITVNVGGARYRMYPSTLRTFPGTKLCHLAEPEASAKFDYDPSTQEFFFDRSAKVFGEVLNYYRTKHLHCPPDVCQFAFQEELAFWGIADTQLAPCCQRRLNVREGQPEGYSVTDVQEAGDNQGFLNQMEGRCSLWWTRWQPKIWALFEKPYSSLGAMCVAVTSLLLCVGLIVIICEESKAYVDVIVINQSLHDPTSMYHTYFPTTSYQQAPYLLHLELLCILWFMFEFSVRFIFCPDKKKFLRNPLNITDFLSLFPVFIELFSSGRLHGWVPVLVYCLGFLRVGYILKLLKTIKLIETPLMLRVLPHVLKSMLREILQLLLVFTVEILVFGTICYFAEANSPESHFLDILIGFWWAAITLTTVGYGDVVPVTPLGRVIGACAAVCGVLTFIIPIPIFFTRFQGYYRAAAVKETMKRRRKEKATLPS